MSALNRQEMSHKHPKGFGDPLAPKSRRAGARPGVYETSPALTSAGRARADGFARPAAGLSRRLHLIRLSAFVGRTFRPLGQRLAHHVQGADDHRAPGASGLGMIPNLYELRHVEPLGLVRAELFQPVAVQETIVPHLSVYGQVKGVYVGLAFMKRVWVLFFVHVLPPWRFSYQRRSGGAYSPRAEKKAPGLRLRNPCRRYSTRRSLRVICLKPGAGNSPTWAPVRLIPADAGLRLNVVPAVLVIRPQIVVVQIFRKQCPPPQERPPVSWLFIRDSTSLISIGVSLFITTAKLSPVRLAMRLVLFFLPQSLNSSSSLMAGTSSPPPALLLFFTCKSSKRFKPATPSVATEAACRPGEASTVNAAAILARAGRRGNCRLGTRGGRAPGRPAWPPVKQAPATPAAPVFPRRATA